MSYSTLASAIPLSLVFLASPTGAQTFQMPPDSERCPSRWGVGDERGSANWVAPAADGHLLQLLGMPVGRAADRQQDRKNCNGGGSQHSSDH